MFLQSLILWKSDVFAGLQIALQTIHTHLLRKPRRNFTPHKHFPSFAKNIFLTIPVCIQEEVRHTYFTVKETLGNLGCDLFPAYVTQYSMNCVHCLRLWDDGNLCMEEQLINKPLSGKQQGICIQQFCKCVRKDNIVRNTKYFPKITEMKPA